MLIAHITDPHLDLGFPRPGEMLGKRLFSAISWTRRRRAEHRREVADRVVADLLAARPDFVAVTGDLINFSLAREFAAAGAWLRALGPPERVGVVPGNHEALVGGFEVQMLAQWAPYVAGDDGRPGFPWLRRRGEVAIIGVSSAVATPPLLASGRVGPVQCAALERILAEAGRAGLFRLVLIHHPPTAVTSRRKGLSDLDAVAAVLARAGAELVLHGHTHRADLSWIDGPGGRVPVMGAPSASMDPATALGLGHGTDAGAWFRIAVARAGDHWQVALRERRALAGGGMGDGAALRFRLPMATLAAENSHA